MLGALRDLIVGYSKSSSASVKCRREIFGRANFHPRVVSLGINVSIKMGDDGRRTGEGKELCRPTEKTPRHYSLDFSSSISSVYTDEKEKDINHSKNTDYLTTFFMKNSLRSKERTDVSASYTKKL